MRYFCNNTFYLITCPTFLHKPILNSIDAKRIVFNSIRIAVDALDLETDFSVMEDHYHLCGYFVFGASISQLIRRINGRSSRELHERKFVGGRVWGNFHLLQGSTREVVERMTGYVLGNPIKHREVSSLGELRTYPFSTYQQAEHRLGREVAASLVMASILAEF